MTVPTNRRGFLGGLGLAAAGAASTPLLGATQARAASASTGAAGSDLAAAIDAMPLVDVHAHPFPALAPITEEILLETLALSAWMLDAYFPAESGQSETVYAKWRAATPAEREKLDRKYGIQRRFDEVITQMRSTLLVHSLVTEMAAFFRCKPTLADVVAARNEYTRGGFWKYVNDLFASVRLEDALVQSGHGVLPAWTEPEPTLADFKSQFRPKVHEVVATEGFELYFKDISFGDFVSAYRDSMRRRAQVEGAVAFKSSIVKISGADVQPVTADEAERAWKQFKSLPPQDLQRLRKRSWRPAFWKQLQDFTLWQCCDVAYQLDVPLHIHSGNGEGQDMISTHYPYKLENVIRYPVELPQKPVQIVLLHAGYPHHMEAAYLTHVFPNAWFDLSIMNPFVNRNLDKRLLEVFEIAPLSKVLYGSDGYHVPELSFLAAKWAKRSLASAFQTLVGEGVLTRDDALGYARGILGENARRLHKLGTSAGSR